MVTSVGVQVLADGDLDQDSGRGCGERWQDSSELLERFSECGGGLDMDAMDAPLEREVHRVSSRFLAHGSTC